MYMMFCKHQNSEPVDSFLTKVSGFQPAQTNKTKNSHQPNLNNILNFKKLVFSLSLFKLAATIIY